MIFSPPGVNKDPDSFAISLNNTKLERIGTGCEEKCFKFVGIHLDDKLDWSYHLEHIRNKMSTGNFQLGQVKNFVPYHIRKTIYLSMVKSHLEYGIIIWGSALKKYLEPVSIMQKFAIRNLMKTRSRAHTAPLFREAELLTLEDIYILRTCQFVRDFFKGSLPQSFYEPEKFFTPTSEVNVREPTPRNYLELYYGKQTSEKIIRLPQIQIQKIWNELDDHLKRIPTDSKFKSQFTAEAINSYI